MQLLGVSKFVNQSIVFVVVSALIGSSTACGWQASGSDSKKASHATKPQLLGVGEVSGTELDLSNLTELMDDGTPQNQLGGFSAIEWIGGNRYLLLPDRGPKDGAVDYWCRFHEAEVVIDATTTGSSVQFKLLRTVILRDRQGRPFPGSSKALTATDKLAHRLDPEGIRRDSQGNIFISDEYGPYLFKFSNEGELLEELAVPTSFKVEHSFADGDQEDQENKSGRRANRGMEGIALTPSGRTLVGLMQSPLLQDAYLNAKGKAVGLNTRLVTIDLESGAQRQLVYCQDKDKHKMHEILAINEHQFLVIEQDGEEGNDAKFKKVTQIDLTNATEINDGTILPGKDLPDSIRPTKKSDYLDLLDPEYGLAGESMPGKIEGLTFGPQLPSGRRILIVCSDNDFKGDEPSRFYVFSVSQSEATLTKQPAKANN
jgi:hypothetical protein